MRTCPSCGWVFPSTYKRHKCRFCGGAFPDKWCSKCQSFRPIDDFGPKHDQGVCIECNKKRWIQRDKDNPKAFSERTRAAAIRRRKAADELYERIKGTEIPFKLLTEEEWLKICDYFGGCAICGSDHIETREFFVKFTEGGRYAPWNVFPMCGKCATTTRVVDNPLVWLDLHKGSAKKLGLNKYRHDKLVNFFITQIERYSNEQKD